MLSSSQQKQKRGSTTVSDSRLSKKPRISQDSDWGEDDDDGIRKKKRSDKGGGGGAGGRPATKKSFKKKALLSHEEIRERICLLCLNYISVAKLHAVYYLSRNNDALSLVSDFIGDLTYNVADPRFPSITCSTCRSKCAREILKDEPNYDLFQGKSTIRNSFQEGYSHFRFSKFKCPGQEDCRLCRLATYRFGGAVKKFSSPGRPFTPSVQSDSKEHTDTDTP